MFKDFILDPSFKTEIKKHLRNVEWDIIPSKEGSHCFGQFIKEIENKLLKGAKDKAIHIEKEAYEKGFAQGEKDGFEFGRKRFEVIVQQFQSILEEINKEKKSLYSKYEEDIINLILSITRKILHFELSLNKDIIIETLKETLRNIVDKQSIFIHLNPIDYQYLTSQPFGLPFLKNDFECLKLISDPNITRGGCLIETSYGDIDATIENQLKEIEKFLLEKNKNSQ